MRISELVGRGVYTHELGTDGIPYLEHEILTGDHPTLEGVLAKIPEHVKVIGVQIPEGGEDG